MPAVIWWISIIWAKYKKHRVDDTNQDYTLLKNLTEDAIAKLMWRNFQPLPSIWLNFTSYIVELCNSAIIHTYSEIRQNFSNSVENLLTQLKLYFFLHTKYTTFQQAYSNNKINLHIKMLYCTVCIEVFSNFFMTIFLTFFLFVYHISIESVVSGTLATGIWLCRHCLQLRFH